MTRIQFSVAMPFGALNLAHRHTFVKDLDRALDSAAGHFDSAWSIDHRLSDDTNQIKGFTLLAYMAARHPRLTFGHIVLCQSFRNPALLAHMSATLHFLSGGRFILGIGAGSRRDIRLTAMTSLLLTRGRTTGRGTPNHQGDVDGGKIGR